MTGVGEAQRWEYAIVGMGAFLAAQSLGKSLAYLGQRGWELVTVYDKASNWIAIENGFMLFKRPVTPGAEPPEGWAHLWGIDQIFKAYDEDKSVAQVIAEEG